MPRADDSLLVPDAAALVDRARAVTGLSDRGPDDFYPALEVLTSAIREEAELTDEGLQIQLRELLDNLCVTLRSQAFHAAHPEIAEQPITAPVVIVGLQRTGTSKLFRNIAADPQWNVLQTWIALDPVPPRGWQPGQPDPRLAAAEDWCASRRWMQQAHSFHARAPEMEALLMKPSFMLNAPALLVPTHQKWLEEADLTPAYRHLRRQLQFIQWQTGAPSGKRWILKSPPHLLSLDALAKVFPDARLVMTHRHPRSSVGSMLKLVELAQRQFARTVDRERIRDVWLRNLSLAIERFMDFRARHGDDRFVHVGFRDFVSDPLPAIERIYAFADAPVTAETRAAAARWHDENPRHADGRFDYDLAEFGLTDMMIDQVFATYLSEFAEWL